MSDQRCLQHRARDGRHECQCTDQCIDHYYGPVHSCICRRAHPPGACCAWPCPLCPCMVSTLKLLTVEHTRAAVATESQPLQDSQADMSRRPGHNVLAPK